MRSKALILANIFATMLVLLISITTIVAINNLGGFNTLLQYTEQAATAGLKGFWNWYFYGYGPYLLIAQTIIYIVATTIGWMALYKKNSKNALIAAFLYLAGTICYVIFIMESIPVIVLGFAGAYNQKKLNSDKTDKPKLTPMSRLY